MLRSSFEVPFYVVKSKAKLLGAFHSTIFSVFFNKNFRKFHVPNETVHSCCTDPIQATVGLVIVLVSRIQKSGTGDNNFVK